MFVFGSNKFGKHFGGAAAFAHKNFGAEWGKGECLSSNNKTYAFPTLYEASTETGPQLKILSDIDLEISFKNFFATIELYLEKEFLLT